MLSRSTCNILLRDKLVTRVVIHATKGFNLQFNSVERLKLKKNFARIIGPLWPFIIVYHA